MVPSLAAPGPPWCRPWLAQWPGQGLLGSPGALLERPEAILSRPEAVLKSPWAVLRLSLSNPGLSWDALGLSWRRIWPPLGLLRPQDGSREVRYCTPHKRGAKPVLNVVTKQFHKLKTPSPKCILAHVNV